MLKKLFKAPSIETPAIHAEEGQSPYLISFRAVRRWYGEWDILSCNYLPLQSFDRLQGDIRKDFEERTYRLEQKDGTFGFYKCATEVHSSGLTRKGAENFIAQWTQKSEGKKSYTRPSLPKP